MLGVSTLMLAAGAAAIGFTTSGTEMSASITVAAFVARRGRAAGGRARERVGRSSAAPSPRQRPSRHPRTGGVEPVPAAVRHRSRHLRVLGAAPQRNPCALRGNRMTSTGSPDSPPFPRTRRAPRSASTPTSPPPSPTCSGGSADVALLLMERDNRFVRFHAMQSTIVFAGAVVRVVPVLLRAVPRLAGFDLRHPARLRAVVAAPDLQGVSGGALQAARRRRHGRAEYLAGPRASPAGSVQLQVQRARCPLNLMASHRPLGDASELRGLECTVLMSPAISEAAVLEALKAVQDPDLHRDIVSLKFVKNLRIDGDASRSRSS